MLICRSSRRRFVTAPASTLPFGGTRTKTTPSRKLAWAESFGKFLVYFAGPLLWHSPEVPRANIKYHSIQSDSVCMRLLLNIRGGGPRKTRQHVHTGSGPQMKSGRGKVLESTVPRPESDVDFLAWRRTFGALNLY